MTLTVPHKSSGNSQFPDRTIARPMANLGNTCYMNAVLQALAACPELNQALDCMPHRPTCPIHAENMEKSRASSPYSNDSSASDMAAAQEDYPHRKVATRKSTRAGRRTPSFDQAARQSDYTFCVLCELEEHLHRVHDNYTSEGSSGAGGGTSAIQYSNPREGQQPVAPTTFVHGFMDHVAPWFQLGQQEDSHEFLRLLIDAMQKACAQARPKTTLLNAPADDDSPTASRTRSARRSAVSQQDTEYPFSLFRGTVESTVTCEFCNVSSSTLDPIEDVGLEVVMQPPPAGTDSNKSNAASTGAPTRSASESSGVRSSSRNTSPIPTHHGSLADVTASLERFTHPESLDAGYKCENCGKVGKATKQSRLADIPPILTLHLKRFRYGDAPPLRRSGREVGQLLSTSGSGNNDVYTGGSGSAKIEGHIAFGEVLELQKYVTPDLQAKQANIMCRLFAVVVHAGKNSHSGHYIAYVSGQGSKGKQWYRMDDGRVTQVPVSQVMQAEAYMLFYRVMKHPITAALSHEYQVKREQARQEQQLRLKIGSADDSADDKSDKSTEDHKLPRKRTADCAFRNGEEWARARRTRSSAPHFIELVRELEQEIQREESLQTVAEQVVAQEPAKKAASLRGTLAARVSSCLSRFLSH